MVDLKPRLVFPGVVAIELPKFTNYQETLLEMEQLTTSIANAGVAEECPLLIVCDDSEFLSASIDNFLWATFTRSNPSHDIHGVNSFVHHKHWGCEQLLMDARIKPHHAPPLIPDATVEKRVRANFAHLWTQTKE
jgi:4-hydroxy-3-polyprenylbenzoate decarboxylase